MTPGIKAAGTVLVVGFGIAGMSGCESRPAQATLNDIEVYRQMVQSAQAPVAEAPADEPAQVFGFAAPWDERQGAAEDPLRNERTQPPEAVWPQRQSTLTPQRRPYLPPADWLPGASLDVAESKWP